MREIAGPDGRIFAFDPNTPQDVMLATLRNHYGPPGTAPAVGSEESDGPFGPPTQEGRSATDAPSSAEPGVRVTVWGRPPEISVPGGRPRTHSAPPPGIAGTPAASSEAEELRDAKHRAGMKLRATYSDQDARDNDIQSSREIVHAVRAEMNTRGIRGQMIAGLPFADEIKAGREAVRRVLSGQSPSLGEGYQSALTTERDAYEEYDQRNPVRSRIAQVPGNLVGAPVKFLVKSPLGPVAKETVTGMIDGAFEGFASGEGPLDRLGKAGAGMIHGGLEGAAGAAGDALTGGKAFGRALPVAGDMWEHRGATSESGGTLGQDGGRAARFLRGGDG